jgi:hypothetical protein
LSHSFAANHYIRDGASGDGSDWANAWDDLPATFVRGDTYYIADGNYGTHDFNTAVSGSTYIYIKKATASAHGTETGWNASYGDGVAVFSTSSPFDHVWHVTTGYWDFDGVVGGGPESWESGHGIKLLKHVTWAGIFLASNDVDYINIKHIEITQMDHVAPPDEDLGKSNNGIHSSSADNVNVSYCFIHYLYNCPIKFTNATDWVVEYSKLGDHYGTVGVHSEILAWTGGDNITFRYNYFYKWRSTGLMYSTGGWHQIDEDWHIHGNIFDAGGVTPGYYMFSCYDSDGGNEHAFARRWRIHNNTFIGLDSPNGVNLSLFNFSVTGEGDNRAYNNIFWNTQVTGAMSFSDFNGWALSPQEPTHDYNWYYGSNIYGESNGIQGGTTDPFVDESSSNYHLSSAIAGFGLSSTFETDMDGYTRGGDATWDRGAFEYVGADITPPERYSSTPGSLPPGTTQYNISLTTTDDSGGANCKWDADPLTAYADMSDTFDTTGGSSHSDLVTGLSDGNTYNYYVRCEDLATPPNANQDDYLGGSFSGQGTFQ